MNRRVLRQVTALGAALAASVVLAAAQGNSVDALNSTDPTPADPELTVGTLPNGLRYYIRQNRRPEQRAVLRLVVNAGSVLEDDDQRGLGHFVEHMAFKGTQHFPKNSLLVFLSSLGSNFGPDANAATNFDETIYALDVRTDKAALSGALLVLEDWAHHISFESDAMESERPVILEEWRQRLGAAARVRDKETAVLLEGSRYAERMPIGIPDVIRTAAVNRVRRFYTDWYRPDLMAIIAVGDFDVDLVRGLIASRFGHIDPPRRPRARPQYSVPAQSGTRFVIAVDPELPRTTISTTTRLPTRDGSTVGGYRQVIADRLLALLLNARLSEATGHADSGVLRVTVGRRPFMARGHDEAVLSATVRDDRAERAFNTLFAEVERVKRFGFTSTEIDRQRQNALRSAERLATDAGTRLSTAHAEDYVRQFLRQDTVPSMVDQAALFRRFVPDITADELNALARTWFSDANRLVVVTGPENPQIPFPSETRLSAILDLAPLTLLTPVADRGTGTALFSSTPMPGTVGRATYIEGAGLTEWGLENGVRVVIKPTTVRNDEVLFRASRRGGTSLVDDETWAKINGAAQIVGASGAGRYTGLDLRKALTGRIAAATPFLSELEEGLGGSSSPQDLETLFQLINLRFTQPRKDAAAFALIKDQTKSGIMNQTSSPDFLIRNALASALTGDNQRRRALDAAAVDQWDLDRSFAFYKDRFSNANGFTFVFVGNVTADTLRPLVAQYIATLPSSEEGSMWRDVGVRPPAQVVERRLVKGLEPKSQVAIAFTGPFEYSEANRLLLRAVTGLLQTRLSEAIREDLGATYSIAVTQTTQPVPYSTYDIRIQWSCAPQRVGELTRRVFEEVNALTETPLSGVVVGSVRTTLDREMQRSLQQNNYVLGQLALKYQLDLDPTEIWTYPAHLQALTATSIRAAAERYLDTKRYVQVTLMPEGDRPATAAATGTGRATVPGRDQP